MVKAGTRQQGITLLELLLAVAILAVVLGISMGILMSAQRLWSSQQERMISTRAGWLWAHRLCKEMRMAIPPAELGGGARWQGTNAGGTLHDALPKGRRPESVVEELKAIRVDYDTIRFPTARLKGREGPGMTEYSLKRDENNGVVGIVRRTAPRGSSLSDAKEDIVNDRVVSLDFEYLDADGKWRQEWKDGSAAPLAVRVTMGTLLRRTRMAYDVMRFSTLVYLPAGSRISR